MLRRRSAVTDNGVKGHSSPIRRYLDGQISSSDYFREVQKETKDEVRRELREAREATTRA